MCWLQPDQQSFSMYQRVQVVSDMAHPTIVQKQNYKCAHDKVGGLAWRKKRTVSEAFTSCIEVAIPLGEDLASATKR